MQELNKKEKYEISGGGLSVTALNDIARLIGTVFDLGKALGSSLRRAIGGGICPLK